MGEYKDITLDRDRAFDINSLNELLTQGKSILNEAIRISQKMETSISAISGIYSGIDGEYKVGALGSDIASLSGTLKKDIYQDTIDRMDKILTKLINDMPSYDNSLAQSMSSIQEVLGSVKGRISELRGLLETGDVNLSYAEFTQRLKDLKAGWDETTEDLSELLVEIEADMYGVTVESVQYSMDPVNLSTGNFVYDHEDIKINGEIPLSFHRYYNSKDRIKGSLGRCFVHNYEFHLEENAEKGKITISMGDGQKKTFQKMEDGTYRSLHSATETLTKEEDRYILTKLTGERSIYNEAGQMLRRENRYGRGITFSYHETGKLKKAETDSNTSLTYSYNEAGQLTLVTDHTGRSVELSYERGKLATVKNPLGNIYAYRYGKNGRIEETVNPRGYTTVKNTYDEKRRITRQEFPDGGHMEYFYDDSKRQVILTERNGSRITYIHDGKYRNTDILYEDGTKEHFEYNGKNQRILHVDRNGNSTRMAYDNRGNLTQIINALGEKANLTYNVDNQLAILKVNGNEKLRNSYDKKGNLISSIGADGNGNLISYDEQGRPVCIENADKSTTKITYDDKGNIEKIQDAGGKDISYQYDSLNRVICITDGNGNKTFFEYNKADKIQRTINPLGNARSYSYNESGKVTKVVDYDGYAVEAVYNEIGKISRITDKEGNATRYFYDSMWNTSQVIQADGGIINYKYDGNNRLCEETLPEGGSTHYTYDGNGNRIGMTDAAGVQTSLIYDALNRVIKMIDAIGAETEYSYDEEGNLACITDAMGNKTFYTYDEMKRCISKTDVMGSTTRYTYDVMGNVKSVQYPNGSVETRSYKDGKLSEIRKADGSSMRYAYDGNGNCICMENGAGEKLTITYDAMNRKQTVTNPDGGTLRYEYDAMGNVTKMTDENGNETRYAYTPNGNLKSVTDALENETRYTYDAMGHLVKMERIGEIKDDMLSGNKTEIQTTTYEWNQRGLVTGIINPLGAGESFRYDENGRMTDQWDREGYHTAYSYDRRGLLKDILYADGTSVAYSYDALRRLEEVKDSIGTTQIVTDALGRVLSVTDSRGKTVGYEWGSMNEKQRLVYPDGKEASYNYNEKGQLEALTTPGGTIRYTYDTMGRLKEKAFPNGITTEYSYNSMGHLETINHSGNGLEEEYSYQYDMAGNKIRACKQRQGMDADSGSFQYGYDALNRLTEVSRDGSLLRRYAYDAFGNRTVKEDYSGQTAIQTTYRYNANNQMISRISDEEEQIYTYDYRGNLTAVSRGEEQFKAFTFDAANRMHSAFEIKDGTGTRAEYTYNAFGNRTGQDIYSVELDNSILETAGQKPQNPERQVYYTLDLTRQYYNLLASEDKVEQKEQTFYWDGNVAAMEEDERDSYYLQDDLGSPMQLMGEEGEIRETYGFDEFGRNLDHRPEKQIQPFGYTGYQMEMAGGLYFAQARRYDANNGRFISEDFVEGFIDFPFSLNNYVYCWNRPLVLVDLDGMWPQWVETVAKVVTVAVAVVAVVAVVATATVATGGAALGLAVAAGATVGGVVNGFVNEANGGSYINGWVGGAVSGGTQALLGYNNPVGFVIGGSANGLGSYITDKLDNIDPTNDKYKTEEEIRESAQTNAIKGMAYSIPGAFMGWFTSYANEYPSVVDALMEGYNKSFGEGLNQFYGIIDNLLLGGDSLDEQETKGCLE